MNRHARSLEHALQILGQEEYRRYIRAIYLYGSCARGNPKYDSDVDLFLQMEADTPKKLLRQMRLDVMPEEEGLPAVELKVNTGEGFSSSRQFNENIEREGKLLWERT